MQTERPFVMSIAGYDPSGGAGLLADIKTFEQMKVQGLGICTAMTLQTESRFFSLEWQPLEQILSGINVLMENYPVRAIKIGVVKDAAFLSEIVRTVRLNNPEAHIVWDPVLKSTSAFSFFDLNTIPALKDVLKLIDLLTPNYIEYKILKEKHLFDDPENSCAVLIKGGHRENTIGTDILMERAKEISIDPVGAASAFYPKHGSGCVLSSAIAGHLAKGENMEQACRKGKSYIEKFLTSTPSLLGFHS